PKQNGRDAYPRQNNEPHAGQWAEHDKAEDHGTYCPLCPQAVVPAVVTVFVNRGHIAQNQADEIQYAELPVPQACKTEFFVSRFQLKREEKVRHHIEAKVHYVSVYKTACNKRIHPPAARNAVGMKDQVFVNIIVVKGPNGRSYSKCKDKGCYGRHPKIIH